MIRYRFGAIIFSVVIAVGLQSNAVAQELPNGDQWIGRLGALLPVDHSRPMTISELCHRLDCLTDELRDVGLIVMKQPDVFSQERMTRFRNDVEQQMSGDLANFHLVLAARINRLDSATTTSTTALGAALSAPGSTNVQAPAADAPTLLSGLNSGLYANSPTLFGSQNVPSSAFSGIGPATNNFNPVTSATASTALGLGVDPTVYLDEKKRFLEHLNQIRRTNLGPDQNDSSGYGLYLVRLPVSITPGKCTLQGHGADFSVTVEHEFTPDFLPDAFKNLVINDIVDEVSTVVYEAIRSGLFERVLKPRHEARERQDALRNKNSQLIDLIKESTNTQYLDSRLGFARQATSPRNVEDAEIAKLLTDYILRTTKPLTGEARLDAASRSLIADRISALGLVSGLIDHQRNELRQFSAKVRVGEPINGTLVQSLQGYINTFVRQVVKQNKTRQATLPINLTQVGYADFQKVLTELYRTALPDDVAILDHLLGLNEEASLKFTKPLAENNATVIDLSNKEIGGYNNLSLPSVRTPKQLYPIAPRELLDFLLDENVFLLAKDAYESSRVNEIRLQEVRAYMRHTAQTAYYAMCWRTEKGAVVLPPLADEAFMRELVEAIRERRFGKEGDRTQLRLKELYALLVAQIEQGRDNIANKPMAALCWAIALDAALLDAALKEDARKVLMAKGLPCENMDSVHFYYPADVADDVSKDIFTRYVQAKWPILTFALDPINDQQNIADSFSLNRDLQLAVSFAFASGQINFSQLNTFRRQIQQSADTIALNRTVSGYIHANDIFGFRFTPRYQNPTSQQTNLQVIASQLVWGGPNPSYQVKKSKLEPGMRELTAILLMPTFLPSIRMEVAGNWFKLTDPRRPVFHTNGMLERGRKVEELRQAAEFACKNKEYRDADLRVLRAKLAQLDAMLPMQSRVVQLPYDNSASGFDLFADGSTALVPELTGFSGVDVIPAGASGSGAPATGTAAATPPATFSTTTLTSPPTTTNVTIAGGTTSVADVFVFGKYISLLDTRVIAGGRSASFEILSREVVHVQIPANVIPTKTEDGKSYVEVYLATPNGISNSLLIPYGPVAPAIELAYRLPAGNPPVDVYYQWLTGGDGKPALVTTAKPDSGKGVKISWDSGTGLAPRQIQAQFVTTINGQNLSMVFQADADTKDDYNIDGQKFAVTLLNLLQQVTVYPSLPPNSMTFTVNVQPWIPNDTEGLRALSKPKTLAQRLTVNMQYNATGINALPGVAPVVPANPPDQPAASGMASRAGRPEVSGKTELGGLAKPVADPNLIRTAQQLALPPAASYLNVPQPPPALSAPALLGPNVSSEAEQVSRILTGQPIATTVSTDLTTAAQKLTSGANVAAAAVQQGAMPTIVVNPSPVVLLPSGKPPEKKKHKSRIGQMFNRIGNRMSEVLPPQ